VVVADPVEFLGGHAGLHVRRDDLQHFGGQAAGLAHLLEVFGGFQLDAHGPIIAHPGRNSAWDGPADCLGGVIRP
jgi:hypothetical protein